MKLKSIIKLGTIMSVLLFCLAVGYYAFMQLKMTDQNRHINLFSFVPSDCVGVLETDNINTFLENCPALSYNHELDGFHFSGLFSFVLGGLNDYAHKSAHGLTNQMNRLVVSFHKPFSPRNQVVYFQMNTIDEQLLVDMLAEYAPGNFLPKEEVYRDKTIRIYPLGDEDFLALYSEDGLVVLSYQKRLIEKVIDTRLDKLSLNNDKTFLEVTGRKKSKDYFTLYTRNAPISFLQMDSTCWCEYDFHLNSDVLFLTGDIFVSDNSDVSYPTDKWMENVGFIKEDRFILSAEKDSTLYYMDQAALKSESGKLSLFDECVASLSQEAAFSMVVDMQEVAENRERFSDYLPPFVLDNARLFQSFVLSLQLSQNENHFSHMWVFTYKN